MEKKQRRKEHKGVGVTGTGSFPFPVVSSRKDVTIAQIRRTTAEVTGYDVIDLTFVMQ